MDYKLIIERMKEAEKEALTVAEREKIYRQRRALEKWIQSGSQGEPPIDISPYLGTGEKVEKVPVELSEPPEPSPFPEVTVETVEQAEVEEPLPVVKEMSAEELEAAEEAIYLERNLRRILEQARLNLEKGEYRSAISLAKEVAQRASGTLQETASNLLEVAQTRLNDALTRALDEGDRYQEEGNDEAARRAYEFALTLDPENAHARSALLKLERKGEERISSQAKALLRARLRERRDIGVLRDAVYEAEALQAEDRLPPDLQELLKEAREFFEQERQRHGEETTQMRFGDLQARQKAIAWLEEQLAKGVKTVWYAVTNTERPTYEMLAEARQLLKEASADTAQYELSLAEKYKRTRPQYALKRLERALEQPFQDDDRRKLEEARAEIERWVQAEQRAEELREQAYRETDPMQRFALLLQAQNTFSELPGLLSQIEQARLLAEETLQSQVEHYFQQVRSCIESEDFARARQVLFEAGIMLARWPEEIKPPFLLQQQEKAEALREELKEKERAFEEYQRLSQEIRQAIREGRKKAALELFQRVSENASLREFYDFRKLLGELDQFKTIEEKRTEARQAKEQKDWARVRQIAQSVVDAGGSENEIAEFKKLLEEATLEIEIEHIRFLIAQDEYREANALWTSLKSQTQSAEKEKFLRERLSEEIEKIERALDGEASMRPLYEQAIHKLGLSDEIALRAFQNPSHFLRQLQRSEQSSEIKRFLEKIQPLEASTLSAKDIVEYARQVLQEKLSQKGIEDRIEALRLLRHVGGIKQETDLPPFAPSMHVADARRLVRLLTTSLRQQLVEYIQNGYHTFQGKEQELDDEEAQQLSRFALLARQTGLLENERERVWARWAEIQWGKRQAQRLEKEGQWQNVLSIWKALDTHYPEHPEVREGFRRARLQSALQRAYLMFYNEHKEGEAIAELVACRADPEMENAWELLATLAEFYAAVGEFEHAQGNLKQIERLLPVFPDEIRASVEAELRKLQESIEQQSLIFRYKREAIEKDRNGHTAEALRILQKGLEDARLRNKEALQSLQQEIFQKASEALFQKAQEERSKGTDEGKIQAVIALVDLQALEELVGIPETQRRSTVELNRLRSELASVADAVIRSASDFDPSGMGVEQALHVASALLSRLQTFDNVIPLFNQELEPIRDRLTKRRRDMAILVENLDKAKEILQHVASADLWQRALQSGDFHELDQARDRITKLELRTLLEARAFERRLDESKEVYSNLMNTIAAVRHHFRNDEFEEVERLIKETSEQSTLRANGDQWQVIFGNAYREIRQLFGIRLRIPDPYGKGDLVGWEAVQEQARERATELEKWREWQKELSYRMEAAEKARNTAEEHQPETPLRHKKMAWERVLDATAQVLSFRRIDGDGNVQIGPIDPHGNPIPIRSRRAREIYEESKKWLEVAQDWHNQAKLQIETLEDLLERRGFPTEAEFAEAVRQNDPFGLEKLLERARQAGVMDETERKRVETYARVLERMRQSKQKKRFWDIFG